MNNNKFNERLKELREEKGLSQGELSQHVNVSRQSIGFYEKGERLPDIETAMNIAQYFNVTTDYLIGLSNNRNEKETIEFDDNFNELKNHLNNLEPSDKDILLLSLNTLLNFEGIGDYNKIFIKEYVLITTSISMLKLHFLDNVGIGLKHMAVEEKNRTRITLGRKPFLKVFEQAFEGLDNINVNMAEIMVDVVESLYESMNSDLRPLTYGEDSQKIFNNITNSLSKMNEQLLEIIKETPFLVVRQPPKMIKINKDKNFEILFDNNESRVCPARVILKDSINNENDDKNLNSITISDDGYFLLDSSGKKILNAFLIWNLYPKLDDITNGDWKLKAIATSVEILSRIKDGFDSYEEVNNDGKHT